MPKPPRAAGTLSGADHQLPHEADHGRHDHAGHAHGEGCGCRHLPSSVEIDTAGSRGAAAGVVSTIRSRPCSGDLPVPILAASMELAWHGALAVLAMSLGKAISIVTLAIPAAEARV